MLLNNDIFVSVYKQSLPDIGTPIRDSSISDFNHTHHSTARRHLNATYEPMLTIVDEMEHLPKAPGPKLTLKKKEQR